MTALGADIAANAILPSILDGKSFPITTVDLDDPIYALPSVSGPLALPVEKLSNNDITERVAGGEGVFDTFMAGVDAHLSREYDKGRITGAEYSKVYVALTEAAMANTVQFLTTREQGYWQAQTAKFQAQAMETATVTSRVQLATAKAQLQALSYEALNNEATYALSKMKLASEDVAYGTAKFQYDNILPSQWELVKEQIEIARAQTTDTRKDGSVIVGSVGKQKDLYSQQITAYQRDSEVKAAKQFTDAWIAQKTIDEGLLAPSGFQNASIDEILTALKTNNGL